jgi:hypothetical protein
MEFAAHYLLAFGLDPLRLVGAVLVAGVVVGAAYIFVKRRIQGILGEAGARREMHGEMIDPRAAAS